MRRRTRRSSCLPSGLRGACGTHTKPHRAHLVIALNCALIAAATSSTEPGVLAGLRDMVVHQLIPHALPAVRVAALPFMRLVAEVATDHDGTARWLVPAAEALAVDADRTARLAGIAALGLVAETATDVDILEKAAQKLQAFAEDASHAVRMAVLRTYTHSAARADPIFRDECMHASRAGSGER